MILILSNKWDVSVDFVIKQLRSSGADYLRLNTEDLPRTFTTINIPELKFLLNKQNKTYDLAKSVNVIWNRRPGFPFEDISESENSGIERFINNQWYTWLECLQLIPDVTWINHPNSNTYMECKPRQLIIAKKMGFNIPQTIISNDFVEINNFIEKNNDCITKALYSPLIKNRGKEEFIFTNEVNQITDDDIENLKISPSIFQQSITPKIDYRVTVVGDDIFPVKISLNDSKRIDGLDWRTIDNGISFELCQLPYKIETLCRNYVRENGLLFGAIDLVEQENEFYFLEINPNGEWGWLQYPHRIPIADSLAKLLFKYENEREPRSL